MESWSSELRGQVPQSKSHRTASCPSPESEPLDLTFGIEIECLLLSNTSVDQDQAIQQFPDSGRKLIHAALSQPLKAVCSSCSMVHEFKLPITESYDSENPGFTNWKIVTDGSLHLKVDELGAFDRKCEYPSVDAIEIQSRILHAEKPLLITQSCSNLGHTHKVFWEDEIQAVYGRLYEAFQSPSGVEGYRLVVNSTCGTHVHIGNGKTGFPLRTVQNVLQMSVTNEKAIDSVHSTDRITGSTLAFSQKSDIVLEDEFDEEVLNYDVYNTPYSDFFQCMAFERNLVDSYRPDQLAMSHDVMESMYPSNAFCRIPELQQAMKAHDVPSWLKIIRGASNIADLQNIHGMLGHQSNVNLENLNDFCPDFSYSGNDKMTIEFRQHAASLDPVQIIAWVHVQLNLFNFCHGHSISAIQDICESQWSNPSHTALDFFKTIGVPHKVYKHYESVLGLHGAYIPCFSRMYKLQAIQAALAFGPDDHFLPLMLNMITERTIAVSPRAKKDKIREKLVNGGYGQYTAEYVQHLDLSPAEKARLTIGWKPDRSAGKTARREPVMPSCNYWQAAPQWQLRVMNPDLDDDEG